MASIFEAMGGYESAPVEETQPAKKRRVDEYTPRLTKQQWRILEALEDGATLSTTYHNNLLTLSWHGVHEWHSRKTITSLVKRNLTKHDGNGREPQVYALTDAGRHALRIREQNKPGQL